MRHARRQSAPRYHATLLSVWTQLPFTDSHGRGRWGRRLLLDSTWFQSRDTAAGLTAAVSAQTNGLDASVVIQKQRRWWGLSSYSQMWKQTRSQPWCTLQSLRWPKARSQLSHLMHFVALKWKRLCQNSKIKVLLGWSFQIGRPGEPSSFHVTEHASWWIWIALFNKFWPQPRLIGQSLHRKAKGVHHYISLRRTVVSGCNLWRETLHTLVEQWADINSGSQWYQKVGRWRHGLEIAPKLLESHSDSNFCLWIVHPWHVKERAHYNRILQTPLSPFQSRITEQVID